MLRLAHLAALGALLSLAGGCAPAAEEDVADEAGLATAGPDEARALEEAAAMLDERPANAAPDEQDAPLEAATP